MNKSSTVWGESAVCYFCFLVFCFFAGQWFQAEMAAASVWAFLTKSAHTSCSRLPVPRQAHPSCALPSAFSDSTGRFPSPHRARLSRCPCSSRERRSSPVGDRCGIPRHSPGAGELSSRGKESKAQGDVERGKTDSEASRNQKSEDQKKRKRKGVSEEGSRGER